MKKKVGCCGLFIIALIASLVFNVAFIPAILVIGVILWIFGKL